MRATPTAQRTRTEPGRSRASTVTTSAAGSPMASACGQVWYQRDSSSEAAKCAQSSTTKSWSVRRSASEIVKNCVWECGTMALLSVENANSVRVSYCCYGGLDTSPGSRVRHPLLLKGEGEEVRSGARMARSGARMALSYPLLSEGEGGELVSRVRYPSPRNVSEL
jgi:hypothetical protein